MAKDFEGDEVEIDGADAADALGSIDFNVEDEYKADPLIPKGTYHGTATAIKFVPAQFCIVWDFCLHDNGGVMNDAVRMEQRLAVGAQPPMPLALGE